MTTALRDIPRRLVQIAAFALIVRPFLTLFMGLSVQHRRNLPKRGPAIIVANHNSHLDTLAMMAQLPLSALLNVRPVAAADHFKTGIIGYLARLILHAILIERHKKLGIKSLDPILAALDKNQIVIFFPEGSRGEAEVIARFRHGISHLVEARRDVPVFPVYLHNMGKCMPKGSWLFVPFNCEMIVGAQAELKTLPMEAVPNHLKRLVEGLGAETSLGRWDVEVGHGLGDSPGTSA